MFASDSPSCVCSPLLGTSVIQVTASDADDPTYGNSAKLVYSILEGQPYFSVEAQTGIIKLFLWVAPHDQSASSELNVLTGCSCWCVWAKLPALVGPLAFAAVWSPGVCWSFYTRKLRLFLCVLYAVMIEMLFLCTALVLQACPLCGILGLLSSQQRQGKADPPPSLQILPCLMHFKCTSQVFIKSVCATSLCACRNHPNCPSQHGQRSQGGVPRGDTGQGHGRTHGRPLRDNQSDNYTYRCQWQPTKVPTEWVPTKSFSHLLPGPMFVKYQPHPLLEEAITDGLLQHTWIKMY